MRQIVLAGMLDRVARRLTTNESNRNKIRPNKAAYYASNLKAIVYIHNSSMLKRSKPEWLVYQEIFEVQDKIYIKGILHLGLLLIKIFKTLFEFYYTYILYYFYRIYIIYLKLYIDKK